MLLNGGNIQGAQRLLSESELLVWANRLKDNIPAKLNVAFEENNTSEVAQNNIYLFALYWKTGTNLFHVGNRLGRSANYKCKELD